jgi:nucleotide-binding universal stress UspA family protein
MTKIIVALDSSLAARSVLASARALASLLDAEVEALHVQTDGDRTVRATAEAAAVRLRTVRGSVIERLVEAGGADDVVALAIGARGTPATRRPLGSTAAAVATALPKPVLIVPPDADPPAAFRRVLVPLEGTLSSSLAPRAMLELSRGAELDVLALHVHDEDSIPAFTDQPQHEQQAWTREFLRRYCPSGLGSVRLETRVGRSGELVPLVAEEFDCELIALGWSQELAAGRASVVRETLERTHRPVLLIPVRSGAKDDFDALIHSGVATPDQNER